MDTTSVEFQIGMCHKARLQEIRDSQVRTQAFLARLKGTGGDPEIIEHQEDLLAGFAAEEAWIVGDDCYKAVCAHEADLAKVTAELMAEKATLLARVAEIETLL